MSYLLTQMFLYMLTTFLLGLLLGWLLWRYGRPNSREITALQTKHDGLAKERDDLRVNLDASRSRSADERKTVDRLRSEKIDLQTQLDGLVNAQNAEPDMSVASEVEVDAEPTPARIPRPMRVTSAILGTAAPVAAISTGTKPAGLSEPRDGAPDNLQEINGVGPKLELMLNDLGYYHLDQIAAWSPAEEAWVDANLEGFKGRVSRDSWIDQARVLAAQ